MPAERPRAPGCARGEANPLPVVFLTGPGDIPTSVRAMRDGAEDFLRKRAPKAELLHAVHRALARDARERESAPGNASSASASRRSRAGARSALPCSSGTLEQTDCRRSRHPRMHGEATSHEHHEEAACALRGRIDAARARGGPPSLRGSSPYLAAVGAMVLR